jgi:hypothetical protein
VNRALEEWEAHVRKPQHGITDVWCGAQRDLLRWDFRSIDHVAAHRLQGGRLLPCPACLKAIVEALQSQ